MTTLSAILIIVGVIAAIFGVLILICALGNWLIPDDETDWS